MRYLNLAPVVILSIIALSAFGTVYSGAGYLVAGGAGLVLGVTLAVLGGLWHWRALPLFAAVVLTYFVFGAVATRQSAAVASVIPTGSSLTELTRALVTSWKLLLTADPPVTTESILLVIPYVCMLVAATLAASAALRMPARHIVAGRALAGAATAGPLLVAIAFGTADTSHPELLGTAFAVVAVGWCATPTGVGVASSAVTRRTKTVGGVLLVAVAGVTALSVAPALTGGDRSLLRDHVLPPLELREYPTPLAAFRNYLKDFRDAPLFTVSGLGGAQRVRLAALDYYDGRIYNVAASGDRNSDSGVFGRIGRTGSGAAEQLPSGDEQSLVITIGEYAGVWIPTPSTSTSIDISGSRGEELASGLFYNSASGTALTTAGLETGDVIDIVGTAPVVAGDADIADRAPSPLTLPAPELIPPEVSEILAAAVEGALTPIEQLRAIEAYLHGEGFYSNGLEGQVRSRAGHNSDRIAVLLGGNQMIGDAEQYAVTMALMARERGFPARVVVGFDVSARSSTPDASVTVTGSDIDAWVEVPFDGIGWVAFDPTPPKDRTPQQEVPEPKTSSDPLVIAPPQPPQDPVELMTTSSPGEREDKDNLWSWVWALLLDLIWLALRTAILLLVLAGPFAIVLLLKERRRRQRRRLTDPAAAVAAGWSELVDTATDLGVRVPAGSTRRETALRMALEYPHAGIVTLAQACDVAVFAPGRLTDEQVEAFWGEVDFARMRVRDFVGLTSWWRGQVNPRSLISMGLFAGLHRQRSAVGKHVSALVQRVRPTRKREWIG